MSTALWLGRVRDTSSWGEGVRGTTGKSHAAGKERGGEGGVAEKCGEKCKQGSEHAKGRRASALSFEGIFPRSIVSKSHFRANLEASKIHSTPYLKP